MTRTRSPRRGRLGLQLLFLLLAALSSGSCSRRLGWGVVLWSNPEKGLPAGSVVPVFIKSNIEQVYVVGVPGGREKAELPLWQLELVGSKAKARARVEAFGGYERSWLVATRDGLPVREKPSALSSARRVYRLREGESVKILEKAEGEIPMTGGQALEGSWFRVLTADGTVGFAFSNTLRLYEEGSDEAPSLAAKPAESLSGRIDLVFSRSWRPEYFQAMVDDERVDLDWFAPRFGFFADSVRRQIRLELPASSKVFNYSTIAEDGGWYLFEGTPLRLKLEGERRMLADWSGRSLADERLAAEAAALAPPPAAPAAATAQGGAAPGAGAAASLPEEAEPPASSFGAGTQAAFVVLKAEIRDTIRDEELRRQELLDALVAAGADWLVLVEPGLAPAEPAPVTELAALAPAPSAPEGAASAGSGLGALAESPAAAVQGPPRLVLSRAGRFTLTAPTLIPPAYLPPDFGEEAAERELAAGRVSLRLRLAPGLESEYGGVFSLSFDGHRGWVDFFFRRDPEGAVISRVDPATVRNGEAGSALSLPPLRLRAAR